MHSICALLLFVLPEADYILITSFLYAENQSAMLYQARQRLVWFDTVMKWNCLAAGGSFFVLF